MSADSIDALLAEASRLYNDGSYQQAIRKWEEVLALDPGNQKARESIKIASLLSDSWIDGPDAPAATEAAAPSEEEQRLQDRLRQVREMIAARDFHAAMKECEALAAAAPDHPEVKALADQARSGMESEPFIRTAIERAGRELRAGKFDMVEVLCRKVLSLDATNRQARTYLYMAQRRSAGEPEEGHTAAAEQAPLEVPEDASGSAADDFGGDVAPEDLAGGATDPDPVAAPVPVAAPPAEQAAPATPFGLGEYETSRGGEIDASQIESIPLGAPRPSPATHTHVGTELVQEGSIYSGPDLPEEEEAPGGGGASPESAPETASATRAASPPPSEISGTPPPAPGRPRSAGAPEGAREEAEPAARPPRPGRSARPQAVRAAAPAAGRSARLKAAAVLLLLLGSAAGAAFWWVRRSAPSPQEVAPNPLRRTQKPEVAPTAGPAAASGGGEPSGPGGGAPPETTAAAGTAASAPAAAVESAAVEEARPPAPADPVARQNLALRRLAEGKELMARGRLEEARAVLAEALDLDPVLFEARDRLDELERQVQEEARFGEDVRTIVSSFEAGDYHSALWKMYRMQEAFPDILSWDPNLAAAWYNWGVKLLKAGNSREALEKFDEALKINPHDREAIRQRTVAERYQSRPRDASYNAYVDGLTLRPLLPIRR